MCSPLMQCGDVPLCDSWSMSPWSAIIQQGCYRHWAFATAPVVTPMQPCQQALHPAFGPKLQGIRRACAQGCWQGCIALTAALSELNARSQGTIANGKRASSATAAGSAVCSTQGRCQVEASGQQLRV